jgi:hypothetical protein
VIGLFFTKCSLCESVIHVFGREDQVTSLFEWHPGWNSSFPCVRPLCGGRAKRIQPCEAEVGYESVPAAAYYRAIHGFGSLNGKMAEAAEVVELLLKHRIVDVNAYPVGQPERTIVRCLTLEDGTRLHLEGSSRGACVFYVEKSGVKSEDSVDVDRAPASSSEDRTEAGPSVEQNEGTIGRDVEADGVEGGHLSGVPPTG